MQLFDESLGVNSLFVNMTNPISFYCKIKVIIIIIIIIIITTIIIIIIIIIAALTTTTITISWEEPQNCQFFND